MYKLSVIKNIVLGCVLVMVPNLVAMQRTKEVAAFVASMVVPSHLKTLSLDDVLDVCKDNLPLLVEHVINNQSRFDAVEKERFLSFANEKCCNTAVLACAAKLCHPQQDLYMRHLLIYKVLWLVAFNGFRSYEECNECCDLVGLLHKTNPLSLVDVQRLEQDIAAWKQGIALRSTSVSQAAVV